MAHPPAECFALVCRYVLRLPAPLALKWWEALHLSAHRTCTWITRRLDRYQGTPERYGAWFIRVIPATSLVHAIEVLCEEARLSRAEATTIEERMFPLMSPTGDWK